MMQMSKEYTEAIFALSSEENCCGDVSSSLNMMADIFEKNDEYAHLLSSPAIPVDERLSLIDEAFSSVHEYALSFLKLLCEKNIVSVFPQCVKEFNNMLASSKSISYAAVTTAIELTDNERHKLVSKLEKMCGNEVQLEEKIDPSLLGGIVIEVDGKILDASIRQHLSDVKDVIAK